MTSSTKNLYEITSSTIVEKDSLPKLLTQLGLMNFYGTSGSNTASPVTNWYADADSYPMYSVAPVAHGTIYQLYDCYLDAGGIKSGSTSNFGITKSGGTLTIGGASGITAGSSVSLTSLMQFSATTINIPVLSASLPVVTDASKNLISSTISLTSQVSGILPIANGGTNSSTALTNGKLMYSSAGGIIESNFNTDGTVLTTNTVPASLTAPSLINLYSTSGSYSGRPTINFYDNQTTPTCQLGSYNTYSILGFGLYQDGVGYRSGYAAGRSCWALSGGGSGTGDVFSVSRGTSGGAGVAISPTAVLNINSSSQISLPLLTASKPLQLDASKNITAANIDLTTQVTGVLPTTNGGTGIAASYTGNKITVTNSTGTQIIEGTSAFAPNWNAISTTGLTYTTGTAGVNLNTMTGSGTTFTVDMVGGTVYFPGANHTNFIVGFVNATTLSLYYSATVVTQTYTIYYKGIQLGGTTVSSQSAYIGPVNAQPQIYSTLNLFCNTSAGLNSANISAFASTDGHPMWQQLNASHDNTQSCFDTYYNGTNFISSSANGSFQLSKGANTLAIKGGTAAQGSTVTLSNLMTFSPTGMISTILDSSGFLRWNTGGGFSLQFNCGTQSASRTVTIPYEPLGNTFSVLSYGPINSTVTSSVALAVNWTVKARKYNDMVFLEISYTGGSTTTTGTGQIFLDSVLPSAMFPTRIVNCSAMGNMNIDCILFANTFGQYAIYPRSVSGNTVGITNFVPGVAINNIAFELSYFCV